MPYPTCHISLDVLGTIWGPKAQRGLAWSYRQKGPKPSAGAIKRGKYCPELLLFFIVHSGPEGSLSQQKLIIYMSYIFKKVMKNAIQIHWNQNRALREFNVMDIYFHLYYGHPQWILRIGEVFPHLYSKLKKYPHSVIYFLKGIIEAYLNM